MSVTVRCPYCNKLWILHLHGDSSKFEFHCDCIESRIIKRIEKLEETVKNLSEGKS